MYVKLESVIIEGFLSISEAEIQLADRGITRIQGINNYDKGSASNGAGKSTILECIIWILTDETARGAKDVINTAWKGWVLGDLKFSVDQESYRLRRTKKHPDYGTSLFIEKNGEDISGNTITKSKEILKRELPFLDKDLITSIILISQGMPGKFSSLKPKNRKEKLEELSNSKGFIDDLQSRISIQQKSISSEINKLESEMSSLEAVIKSHEVSISKKREYLSQEENNSETLSEEDTSNLQARASELNQEYQRLSQEYSNLSQLKSDLSSKTAELNSELNNIEYTLKSHRDQQSFLTRELESCKVNIVILGQEYSSITEHAQCSRCLQKISNSSQIESMKADLTAKIRDTKSQMTNHYSDISRIDELVSNLEIKREIILEGLSYHNSEILQVSTKLDELNNLGSHINDELSELSSKLAKSSISPSSLNFIKQEIEDTVDSVVELRRQVTKIDNSLEELKKTDSVLKWLARQSSREFRSYILQGVVEYLNSQLLSYSSILYPDTDNKIELHLDKNDLELRYNGRSYENLSGGERRRVDLATQLALRDLCRNETGLAFNILGLDEIFDNLDAIGIQNCLELLKHKSSEVESLYIISHNDNLSMPYDSQIVISKTEDGYSKVLETI
ncbi:exonuclease [Listeria phage LIS04]|nr:exonuclease [Listeria phage LIS04]